MTSISFFWYHYSSDVMRGIEITAKLKSILKAHTLLDNFTRELVTMHRLWIPLSATVDIRTRQPDLKFIENFEIDVNIGSIL